MSAGTAAPRERLPLLDPLRVLASIAVVHHHARGGLLAGVGFGLPLFLVLLVGLAASGRDEPLACYARRRTRELVVPWLRWSLVYVVLLALADLGRGRAPQARLELAMLVQGGHPALWFLPFAAVAVVAAKALRRGVARMPPAAARAAALLAALAWCGPTSRLADAGLAAPFPAWVRASPSLFWGLALATCLGTGTRTRVACLALAAGTALAGAVLATAEHAELARRYAVAVPLACAGFAFRPRVPAAFAALASLCFGVYLVHPLVAKVLATAFQAPAWPAPLHTALVWTLAAISVAALRALGLRWHELRGRGSPAESARAHGADRRGGVRATTAPARTPRPRSRAPAPRARG